MHGPHPHRSKGVATFFHSSIAGFASLKLLSHCAFPTDTSLFERSGIPPLSTSTTYMYHQRDFEPASRHFVGSDFNLAVDAALDTTAFHPNHHVGKDE
ncbi:hypothetical protein H257_18452 [Aphanomyces astaci]|uniref:Uncharacterized protein n=1 Tax=Aphanomyces astaci TaxID=112090 RepID=W4FCU4_APHAT|nr:hypothetical protein H257_18452 [Aphanomyces astaci]ETV64714.1 hypothetical protein H257_18452 [Aphanomyces astaci]|eukprot:XP_009845810.1 hypothetical protein H257_18452 [Aphanomyces astaci]